MASFRERRRRRVLLDAAKSGDLREFVYLDDMSVYSLLAARRGPVPTDFTQTETASASSEVGAGLNVGAGPVTGGPTAKLQSARTSTAHVVRKSSAQTRFKQMLAEETDRLAIRAQPLGAVPALDFAGELDDATVPPNDWIVVPRRLRRGDLVELEVFLEADPAFKLAETINAFTGLVGQETAALGLGDVEGVREAAALSHLLEQLLGGLVPIRARAAEYRVIKDAGRPLLVRTEVLSRFGEQLETEPLLVTGFAEAGLFLKDPRRVLFAGDRYTMMCRLTANGLESRATPILLADVLATIDPTIGQKLQAMTRGLLPAAQQAAADTDEPRAPAAADVLLRYAEALAGKYGLELDRADVELLLPDPMLPLADDVDAMRVQFAPVTRHIYGRAGRDVDHLAAAQLRAATVSAARAGKTAQDATHIPTGSGDEPQDVALGVEIVAVYW